MSTDRHKRDTVSLEEATDSNLWELAAMVVGTARTGSLRWDSEWRKELRTTVGSGQQTRRGSCERSLRPQRTPETQ